MQGNTTAASMAAHHFACRRPVFDCRTPTRTTQEPLLQVYDPPTQNHSSTSDDHRLQSSRIEGPRNITNTTRMFKKKEKNADYACAINILYWGMPLDGGCMMRPHRYCVQGKCISLSMHGLAWWCKSDQNCALAYHKRPC
jgi:hypothetical protein